MKEVTETKPKRQYNRKPKVAPATEEVRPSAEYFEALAEEYKKNAESAYERIRQLEAEMARMRAFYANTMDFCNEQVGALAKTIKLATKGEF